MKRVVVLGGGESGAGAAVLAKVKGFDVFLSDSGVLQDDYKSLLQQYDIAFEEGKHTEDLIYNANEVIKSPGIPDTAPVVASLLAQGTPVISEIEFAGRYSKAKKICITGSNGKTTTTSIIYFLLKNAGLMWAWAETSERVMPIRWRQKISTTTCWRLVVFNSTECTTSKPISPYCSILRPTT